MTTDKVRENRLRRMANRQSLRLLKPRPREGFRGYMICDHEGRIVAGGEPAYSLDMDAVERFLTSPRGKRRR